MDQTMALCDFCGDPAVRWIYPRAPLTTTLPRQQPGQAGIRLDRALRKWVGSCDACSSLIEQDCRGGRAERGAHGTNPVVLVPMTALFEQFFASRLGPRRPTT